MLSNYHNQCDNRKAGLNPIWREIWKKKFNSNFGLYFYRQKKYKIQSKNIIMCCEFVAKIHLDAQNIEQLWYRAFALEFLLTALAHLTIHGHTNSSTHLMSWALTFKLTHNGHLMAKTSLICIFMSFLKFLYYNWLLYSPINIFFFWKGKITKSPPSPSSVYFLNTSQKLALVWAMSG